MPDTIYRHRATTLLEREAARGVREQGWNTGPAIRKYQRADGLVLDPDTGYPYCASAVVWAFEEAGRPLVELHESASVGILLQLGTQHGWKVTRPQRGDIACFYWGGPGDGWPDHTGLVRKPLPGGLVLTVEANTSSDDAGSQDEGDGVFLKTRDPGRYRIAYLRVPGSIAKPDPVARATFAVMRGTGQKARTIAVATSPEGAAREVERLLNRGAHGVRVVKRPPQTT